MPDRDDQDAAARGFVQPGEQDRPAGQPDQESGDADRAEVAIVLQQEEQRQVPAGPDRDEQQGRRDQAVPLSERGQRETPPAGLLAEPVDHHEHHPDEQHAPVGQPGHPAEIRQVRRPGQHRRDSDGDGQQRHRAADGEEPPTHRNPPAHHPGRQVPDPGFAVHHGGDGERGDHRPEQGRELGDRGAQPNDLPRQHQRYPIGPGQPVRQYGERQQSMGAHPPGEC